MIAGFNGIDPCGSNILSAKPTLFNNDLALFSFLKKEAKNCFLYIKENIKNY